MIQLTLNIPDNYKQETMQLLAYLQSLNFIESVNQSTNNEFVLSEEQKKSLDEISKSSDNEFISLEKFNENFKLKYGL